MTSGALMPATAWRRHVADVEREFAVTWGGRLGLDAQRAVTEVVLATQVTLAVLAVWVVAMVVVLAYFDRPGTSNGPTEATNGRLEHLRDSALGFRNLTNCIARSLLETGSFRPRLHPAL